MKILQLIQAKQYRGAEIFCCQLSNHLLDLNHDVLIVSIYGGNAELPFKKNIVALNRPRNMRYYDIYGWREISKIISKFQPDIVQANAADTLKYALFSKIIFKWQVPVIFRNASATSFYIKNFYSRYFNYFLLKQVDLIISVSESSKRDLNKVFPFTSIKTIVIPVGIELFSVAYSEKIFPQKEYNIIHVGSFTREKNHHGLIDIFKILLKRNNQFRLHLFGEGKLKEEIENRIEREKLNDHVVIHGGVKNPLPYIKAANALVLPSNIEGLPGVLLEAMFCKTPVVAYDVGGVREIILPDTGFLIKKDDKISFAEAVFQISLNPDNAKIEKAYEQVLNKFINHGLAREFSRVYLDLINRP